MDISYILLSIYVYILDWFSILYTYFSEPDALFYCVDIVS